MPYMDPMGSKQNNFNLQNLQQLQVGLGKHQEPQNIDYTCAMVKSRYIGDKTHPTFNDGNPYNGYINPLLLGWWPFPIIWK